MYQNDNNPFNFIADTFDCLEDAIKKKFTTPDNKLDINRYGFTVDLVWDDEIDDFSEETQKALCDLFEQEYVPLSAKNRQIKAQAVKEQKSADTSFRKELLEFCNKLKIG